MNFELSEDQNSVLTALNSIVSKFDTNAIEPMPYIFSSELDAALRESGFFNIAREEGFSSLDGAIVIERLARAPQVVETAASILIAPFLPVDLRSGSIAMDCSNGRDPIRFLPLAQYLLTLNDDHVSVAAIDPGKVAHAESLLAYPYGRLGSACLDKVATFDDVELVRRRWQIGIAAEAAGCMAAALELVLDHVKTRFAFGRPLGSFQAIQHRLAMAAETAEAVKWLAFRAAWSDESADAALAAGFAQGRTTQFTYDLHQFCGAMGLTLEFPLHLWTYRLRALAGELGGASVQARRAAASIWGEAA